jgi:hypothetical protein
MPVVPMLGGRMRAAQKTFLLERRFGVDRMIVETLQQYGVSDAQN